MELNNNTFALFAAKYYDNPQCHDEQEFFDDLKRFQYLKRLFKRYQEVGELRERLILNHIVVLYNCFGDAATVLLFFKLMEYKSLLKPFLVLLNRMPEVLIINNERIYNSNISMDDQIVKRLRQI